MTSPVGFTTRETQLTQQRDALDNELRATQKELGEQRLRSGQLQRQLTQTELTLSAEELRSIRELTAAVTAERQAARYLAAWRSARRRADEYRAAVDTLLDDSEMGRLVADTAEQLDAATATIDAAYRERAHLTAWLAALHPAVIAPAPDVEEPGWQILYITAGGRQLSWHIAPRDAELYAHVEHVPDDDPRTQWDGHTTEAKYEAIRGLASASLGRLECGCQILNGCDCGMTLSTEVVRGGRRLRTNR